MKKNITLLLIALLLLGVALADTFKPKPLNWELILTNRSTMPFGCKALFELLPQFFGKSKLQAVILSPYELLSDKPYLTDNLPDEANYIFIDQYFNPDEYDIQKILDFAAAGNSLFIAAEDFAEAFSDKLQFKTNFNIGFSTSDTLIPFAFTQPAFSPDSVYYFQTRHIEHIYFSKYPTQNTQILSTYKNNDEPCLIAIKWHKGFIYLSTMPLAFTNYYVLHPQNHAYAAHALSYLPPQTTYWDEFHKPEREGYGRGEGSPLRFVLSQPALKWAVYLSVCTVLMIVLVESKRKQRAIPIIKPLPNTTLQFTKTVSMLYFKNHNHKDLAEKKIQYFMAYLRTKMFIRNVTFDSAFYRQLAYKTGLSENDIIRLFNAIQSAQQQPNLSEEQLLSLCRNIDRFYQHTGKQEV